MLNILQAGRMTGNSLVVENWNVAGLLGSPSAFDCNLLTALCLT